MRPDHPLPCGKVPADLLAELLAQAPLGPEVVVGPRVGEDCAAVRLEGGRLLLVKADPITFVAEDVGEYALQVNANDIAAMGGVPRWFLATLLLPEGTTPGQLRRLFGQLVEACRRLGVSLCGGHTEVTPGLDRPLLAGAMLGEVGPQGLITTAGARPGDLLLLTKPIAIEGTSIIARARAREVRDRHGEEFLQRCLRLVRDPGIGVVRDARLLLGAVRVHALHDPTEGGLAGALRELARASGHGVRLWGDAVPVLPECAQLCRDYGLDPLGLIASGSLLASLPPGEAERALAVLRREGLTGAALIGEVVEEGLVLLRSGREEPLPAFAADEVTRVL